MRKSESIREALQENEPFKESDKPLLERLGIKTGRSYEQKRLRKAGYNTFAVPCGDNEDEYELKYIYTGRYYRQDMSKNRRILVRLVYAALLACVVLLFVSSGGIAPLNTVWYVTLPQAVCIPLFAWLLKNIVVGILSASNDLEEREYKSLSAGTKNAAVGATAGCTAEVVGVLIFVVINGAGVSSIEVRCAVKYVFCAVMMFTIYLIETHIRYKMIEQKVDIPKEYIRLD